MMPDCDREGRMSYLTLTPLIDFFLMHISFLIIFFFLFNAVTSIANVRYIVMKLLWLIITSLRSVTNLNDGVRDVH